MSTMVWGLIKLKLGVENSIQELLGPYRWLGTNLLNYHLLPFRVHIKKKAKLGVELGFKPRYFIMRSGLSKKYLNHFINYSNTITYHESF